MKREIKFRVWHPPIETDDGTISAWMDYDPDWQNVSAVRIEHKEALEALATDYFKSERARLNKIFSEKRFHSCNSPASSIKMGRRFTKGILLNGLTPTLFHREERLFGLQTADGGALTVFLVMLWRPRCVIQNLRLKPSATSTKIPNSSPQVSNMETKKEMRCCDGKGTFAKCGRGEKKGCTGVHCRCMLSWCPKMHYVDCREHYIHVEFVEPSTEPSVPKGNQMTSGASPTTPMKNDWEELNMGLKTIVSGLSGLIESNVRDSGQAHLAQMKLERILDLFPKAVLSQLSILRGGVEKMKRTKWEEPAVSGQEYPLQVFNFSLSEVIALIEHTEQEINK